MRGGLVGSFYYDTPDLAALLLYVPAVIYLSSEPTGLASLRQVGWLELWGYHCRLLAVVGWAAFVAGSGGKRRYPPLPVSLPDLSPSLDVVVSPSSSFLWCHDNPTEHFERRIVSLPLDADYWGSCCGRGHYCE